MLKLKRLESKYHYRYFIGEFLLYGQKRLKLKFMLKPGFVISESLYKFILINLKYSRLIILKFIQDQAI